MITEEVATIPVFCRYVPEGPSTFDVVGIEVFSLASPEETTLPADGTVAETLAIILNSSSAKTPDI